MLTLTTTKVYKGSKTYNFSAICVSNGLYTERKFDLISLSNKKKGKKEKGQNLIIFHWIREIGWFGERPVLMLSI